MLSSNTPIVDWSGRRVWLIGASDGIGLALGQLLLTKGASLVVSARREEALAQRFPAPAVRKLPLDVNDSSAVGRAIEQLQAEDRLPDVVVWMVGQYEPTGLLELSPQTAKAVLQTNLLSADSRLVWSTALAVWGDSSNKPVGSYWPTIQTTTSGKRSSACSCSMARPTALESLTSKGSLRTAGAGKRCASASSRRADTTRLAPLVSSS